MAALSDAQKKRLDQTFRTMDRLSIIDSAFGRTSSTGTATPQLPQIATAKANTTALRQQTGTGVLTGESATSRLAGVTAANPFRTSRNGAIWDNINAPKTALESLTELARPKSSAETETAGKARQNLLAASRLDEQASKLKESQTAERKKLTEESDQLRELARTQLAEAKDERAYAEKYSGLSRANYNDAYASLANEAARNTDLSRAKEFQTELNWLKSQTQYWTAETYDQRIAEIDKQIERLQPELRKGYDSSTVNPAKQELSELRRQRQQYTDAKYDAVAAELIAEQSDTDAVLELLDQYLYGDNPLGGLTVGDTSSGSGAWYDQNEAAMAAGSGAMSANPDWSANQEREEATAALKKLGYTAEEIEQMANFRMRWKDTEAANSVAAATQQFASEHPVLATAASVPLNLILGGAGYFDTLIQTAINGDKPINYNSPAQIASQLSSNMREAVGQKIADNTDLELFGANVASSLYSIATSVLDSAAVVSSLGAGGTYLLGLSAASQGVVDAKQNGATDGQALALGTLAGVFETLFEKVSLDHLVKMSPTGTWKSVIGNVLKQGGIEMSEEVSTSLANSAADLIVMADRNAIQRTAQAYTANGYTEEAALRAAWKDWSNSLIWDALGGLISGGVMSAGKLTGSALKQKTHQIASDYRTGSELLRNEAALTELLGLASRLDIQAEGIPKTVKAAGAFARNVSNVFQERVASATYSDYVAAATARLNQLGEDANNAELVAKAAIGQTLSEGERSKLAGSQSLQGVVAELTDETGELSSAYTENRRALQSLVAAQAADTQEAKQYEATAAANPEATVLTPLATKLAEQTSMGAEKAQTQAALLGRVFQGESLSAQELRQLDVRNAAVQAAFTENTGIEFTADDKSSTSNLRAVFRKGSEVMAQTRASQAAAQAGEEVVAQVRAAQAEGVQAADAAFAAQQAQEQPVQTEQGSTASAPDVRFADGTTATREQIIAYALSQNPNLTSEQAEEVYRNFLMINTTYNRAVPGSAARMTDAASTSTNKGGATNERGKVLSGDSGRPGVAGPGDVGQVRRGRVVAGADGAGTADGGGTGGDMGGAVRSQAAGTVPAGTGGTGEGNAANTAASGAGAVSSGGVSTASLGIKGGATDDSLEVIKYSKQTLEQRNAVKELKRLGAKKVVLVNGMLSIDGKLARGYTRGSTVILSVSDTGASVTQLAGHEGMHLILGGMSPAQKAELRMTIQHMTTSAGVSGTLYGAYKQRYWNMLKGTIAQKQAQVWDEILCDMYGGINAYEAYAGIWQDTMRTILQQVTARTTSETSETTAEKASLADEDVPVSQEISSAGTSIKQVLALFRNKNVQFEDVNIDIGGGRFDLTTEFLAERGTTNLLFDPYNRDLATNRATLDFLRDGQKADTATCANVLNVIAEPNARYNVILEAAKSIKPDGRAYFTTYEGDGSGVGRATSAGWQNNRKTESYVPEIQKYFDSVVRQGSLIIATNPKSDLPQAVWEVQPGVTERFSLTENDTSQDPYQLQLDADGTTLAELTGAGATMGASTETSTTSKSGIVLPESYYDTNGYKVPKKMRKYMKNSYARVGQSLDGRLEVVYRGASAGKANPAWPGHKGTFWSNRAVISNTYAGLSSTHAFGYDGTRFGSKLVELVQHLASLKTAGSFDVQSDAYKQLAAEIRNLATAQQKYTQAVIRLDRRKDVWNSPQWKNAQTKYGKALYEGYLRIERPYIVQANGKPYFQLDDELGDSTDEVVNSIRYDYPNEYDGIIFVDVIDSMTPGQTPGDERSNVYVTFEQNQFKSTANADPTDDWRAAYSLADDVSKLEKFEPDLEDATQPPAATAEDTETAQRVYAAIDYESKTLMQELDRIASTLDSVNAPTTRGIAEQLRGLTAQLDTYQRGADALDSYFEAVEANGNAAVVSGGAATSDGGTPEAAGAAAETTPASEVTAEQAAAVTPESGARLSLAEMTPAERQNAREDRGRYMSLADTDDAGRPLSDDLKGRTDLLRTGYTRNGAVKNWFHGTNYFGDSALTRDYYDVRSESLLREAYDIPEGEPIPENVPRRGGHYFTDDIYTGMSYLKTKTDADPQLDPKLRKKYLSALNKVDRQEKRHAEVLERYFPEYSMGYFGDLPPQEDLIDLCLYEGWDWNDNPVLNSLQKLNSARAELRAAEMQAALSSPYVMNSEDAKPIGERAPTTLDEGIDWLVAAGKISSSKDVHVTQTKSFLRSVVAPAVDEWRTAAQMCVPEIQNVLDDAKLFDSSDPRTQAIRDALEQTLTDLRASIELGPIKSRGIVKNVTTQIPAAINSIRGLVQSINALPKLDPITAQFLSEDNPLRRYSNLIREIATATGYVREMVVDADWNAFSRILAQPTERVVRYEDKSHTEHYYPSEADFVADINEQRDKQIPGIYNAYLALSNPYIVNKEQYDYNWNELEDSLGSSTREIEVRAEALGYDGVIYRHIMDLGPNVGTRFPFGDVVVVFNDDSIIPVEGREHLSLAETGYPTGSIQDTVLTMLNSTTEEEALQILQAWMNGVTSGATQASESEQPLVNRVFQPKVKDTERQVIRDRLNTLAEEYGEIPAGEKAARDAGLPKQTSDNTKVRQFYRTATEAELMPEHMVPNIERAILTDVASSYVPIKDKAAIGYARRQIEERGFDRLLKEWEGISSPDHNPTKRDIAVGELLMTEAAKVGDTATTLRLLADIAAMGTQAGQVVQAMRLLKKMSPSGQLYYLQKAVDRLNTQNADRIAKGTADTVELNQELVMQVLQAQTADELDSAMDKLLQDVADQLPVTLFDKWTAWRYLAMLGNPRTHIRNLFGNAIFMPARFMKDVLAAGGEALFIRDKTKRTKNVGQALASAVRTSSFGLAGNTEFSRFASEDFEAVRDAIVNGGKMNPADLLRDKRTIWKSSAFKWLNSVQQFNYHMLEAEDGIFLKKAYVSALSQYLAAQKADLTALQTSVEGQKLLNRARQYAILEAQKATYRDFSAAANALNRLKRVPGLNILVDGLLPFTKTPINILKRGAEFSPLGLAKALTYDLARVRKGDITASEAIDHLAAGLTGTLVAGLGMFLAHLGVLVGGSGDDEKQAGFDELQGYQNYSLQIGDVSYTIDWTAPVALPLFVGVELQRQLADGKLTGGELLDAMSLVAEPMFSLSMLDGLNSTLKSAGYDENPLSAIAASTIIGYFGQAMPTLTGQIARTIDPYRRMTYVDKNSDAPSALSRFIQSTVMGKVPGLASQRTPYVDIWGRPDTTDSMLLRGLENLLSPGYINVLKTSAVDTELQDLADRLGDTSVLPTEAERYFTVNKVRKDLTAEEYVRYATVRGQTAYSLLRDLMVDPAYDILTDAEKQLAIMDVYTYATQTAKLDIAPEYDADRWVVTAQSNTASTPVDTIVSRVLQKSNPEASTYEVIASMDWLGPEAQGGLIVSEYYPDKSFTDPRRSNREYQLTPAQQQRETELYQELFWPEYNALLDSSKWGRANDEHRMELLDNLRSDIREQTRKQLATELREQGVESIRKN